MLLRTQRCEDASDLSRMKMRQAQTFPSETCQRFQVFRNAATLVELQRLLTHLHAHQQQTCPPFLLVTRRRSLSSLLVRTCWRHHLCRLVAWHRSSRLLRLEKSPGKILCCRRHQQPEIDRWRPQSQRKTMWLLGRCSSHRQSLLLPQAHHCNRNRASARSASAISSGGSKASGRSNDQIMPSKCCEGIS